MKAIIQEVKFIKEFETQFGKLYSFKVVYDNEVAFYNSKSKDQKYFTEGKEAEFEETVKTYTDKQGNLQEYKVIKPISQKRQSSFGKALTKEQSRYSGFAMSYSKDLVVAGKVELRDIIVYARMMFDEMVAMDKSLEA
jgi:hypothetical protein